MLTSQAHVWDRHRAAVWPDAGIGLVLLKISVR
jgi:hypothetical protein